MEGRGFESGGLREGPEREGGKFEREGDFARSREFEMGDFSSGAESFEAPEAKSEEKLAAIMQECGRVACWLCPHARTCQRRRAIDEMFEEGVIVGENVEDIGLNEEVFGGIEVGVREEVVVEVRGAGDVKIVAQESRVDTVGEREREAEVGMRKIEAKKVESSAQGERREIVESRVENRGAVGVFDSFRDDVVIGAREYLTAREEVVSGGGVSEEVGVKGRKKEIGAKEGAVTEGMRADKEEGSLRKEEKAVEGRVERKEESASKREGEKSIRKEEGEVGSARRKEKSESKLVEKNEKPARKKVAKETLVESGAGSKSVETKGKSARKKRAKGRARKVTKEEGGSEVESRRGELEEKKEEGKKADLKRERLAKKKGSGDLAEVVEASDVREVRDFEKTERVIREELVDDIGEVEDGLVGVEGRIGEEDEGRVEAEMEDGFSGAGIEAEEGVVIDGVVRAARWGEGEVLRVRGGGVEEGENWERFWQGTMRAEEGLLGFELNDTGGEFLGLELDDIEGEAKDQEWVSGSETGVRLRVLRVEGFEEGVVESEDSRVRDEEGLLRVERAPKRRIVWSEEDAWGIEELEGKIDEEELEGTVTLLACVWLEFVEKVCRVEKRKEMGRVVDVARWQDEVKVGLGRRSARAVIEADLSRLEQGDYRRRSVAAVAIELQKYIGRLLVRAFVVGATG